MTDYAPLINTVLEGMDLAPLGIRFRLREDPHMGGHRIILRMGYNRSEQLILDKGLANAHSPENMVRHRVVSAVDELLYVNAREQGDAMTEQEWLTSKDPAAMMHYLMVSPVGVGGRRRGTEEGGPVLISRQQAADFIRVCMKIDGQSDYRIKSVDAGEESYLMIRDWCADHNDSVGPEAKAHLLREIVGNPHRPVKYYWVNGVLCEELPAGNIPDDVQPVLWLSPTVHDLAQAIYDGELGCNNCSYWLKYESKCRSCGTSKGMKGQFQSHLMPILGDALEEAGCTNEDILRHCRGEERCTAGCQKTYPSGKYCHYEDAGPYESKWHKCRTCKATGWMPLRGPHVRGCWVVSLLLDHE